METLPFESFWPYANKPADGESLDSWLVRLAHGNGLSTSDFLRHLVAIAGVSNPTLSMPFEYNATWKRHKVVIKEHLVKHTQSTLEEIDGLESGTASLRAREVVRRSILNEENEGNDLPIRRKYLTQFCPECISEAPHAAREWQLPFVVLCRRHRVLLLERCPHCLSIYRPEGHGIYDHHTICSNRNCQFRLTDSPDIQFKRETEGLLRLQDDLIAYTFTGNDLPTESMEPAFQAFVSALSNHRHGSYHEQLVHQHVGDLDGVVTSNRRIGALLHVLSLTLR